MLADPEEGLGRQFEIDEDMADLCVAVGAALFAGSDAPEQGNFRLEPIPTETDFEEIVVAGSVAAEEEEDPTGCLVTLTHNGQDQSMFAEEGGQFYMTAELQPESENQFDLRAETAEGTELAHHTFSVTHSAGATEVMEEGAGVDALPSYLAKTLYVMTNSGPKEVAPEGKPLPLDVHIDRLVTTGHESTEVAVELYQEDLLLADLILSDFSPPAPRGSAVELTVHVGRDYKMSAEATIPSVGARDAREDIQIPKPPRPEVAELERRFADLQSRVSEFLQNLPPGTEKMSIGAKTDEQLEEIKQLLEDPAPDVFRIDRLLNNLDRYLKEGAQSTLKPTEDGMNALFRRVREALGGAEDAGAQIDAEEWNRTLEVLNEQAEQARQNRDQTSWKRIAVKLEEMAKNLEGMAEAQKRKQEGGGGAQMDPPVLAMQLQALVQHLEEQAREKGKGTDPEVQKCLREARAQLNQIDVGSPQAMQKLIAVYQGPIQRAMTLIDVTVSEGPGIEMM
jgi:hypothetical protein